MDKKEAFVLCGPNSAEICGLYTKPELGAASVGISYSRTPYKMETKYDSEGAYMVLRAEGKKELAFTCLRQEVMNVADHI
mgnify:CR=1 FL=1